MFAIPEHKDQLEREENRFFFFFFLNKKGCQVSYVETKEREVTCLYTYRHIIFMLGCGNVK